MMSKVESYYRIQKGKEESMGDYMQRYAKLMNVRMLEERCLMME